MTIKTGTNRRTFLWNFIRNPRQVGSVTPSSRWLCRKLVNSADLVNCDCVVEYGPGTASLTREILGAITPDVKLLAFEINREFVEILDKKIRKENLILINASAEDVEKYLRQHGFDAADYIFSGLPFTTLPVRVKERILWATNCVLKPGGKFIIYQYSLYLLKTLKKIFDDVEVSVEIRNIPPAFCFVCTKRNGDNY
jgi:phospholipid N-methyltransferase